MPVSRSSYSNRPVTDSAFQDLHHKTHSSSPDYLFPASKLFVAPETSFQYHDSTFDFFNDESTTHQDYPFYFADADSSALEWTRRGGDRDLTPANHHLHPPPDLYTLRLVHARATSNSTIASSLNSHLPRDIQTITSPTSSTTSDNDDDDDSFQFSSPASYLRRITLTSAQGHLMDRSYSRRSLDYNNHPNSTTLTMSSAPALPAADSSSNSSTSIHSNARDASSSTSRTNNGDENDDKPDQSFRESSNIPLVVGTSFAD